MNELKPGIKTTEFLVVIVLIVVSVLALSGLITKNEAMQAISFVFAVLAALGYGTSRIYLKAKQFEKVIDNIPDKENKNNAE